MVTDFRSLRPAHVLPQAASLEWLSAAHEQAEATLARLDGRAFDAPRFREQIARLLSRFGCRDDKITTRGHELADCGHTRWSEMDVYRLDEKPGGEGALVRAQVFSRAAEGALHRLYAERPAPADLLHVTCTGYVSPSAAQRLVEKRGWGAETRVLHAYHMGCYAAFPALRIAAGLVATNRDRHSPAARRTDIAHTEICSLHVNPLQHSPEQLVVQTLFADGFIAYSTCDEADWDRRSAAFELLSIDEQLVTGSSELMTWTCSDLGMQMSLSREVPERLATVVAPFVERLFSRAGLEPDRARSALYAIHPGGPRILDGLQAVLGLEEQQLAFSRKVLRERGNMSSATLPHIWLELLESRAVAGDRPIVSLAFGPGLTICGSLMRKVLV
jgi:predicted naringenin-chalcone synthase